MPTIFEVFWLLAVPVILFSWYHIIRHATGYIPSTKKIKQDPHPKIIFQIAARRLTSLVEEPVACIKKSCADVGFSNYEIRLVVDEIKNNIEGVQIILVPKEYNCMSRYKARALNYGVGFLPDSKDVWILHLDEDALVTPHCVSNIISYIEQGGNPVANGPTVFPYDGNILTFFAEAQRQWTFYWLIDQETTSRVHWLNGSNLLIRSDIEHAVGWDFINCYISEDARFGYEATKKFKGAKIFGWHGGLTIEKPAVSVKSLLKQRMRWFFGSILNLRYVPKGRLPRRLYAILSWVNGLILTLFFLVFITGIYEEPWVNNPFLFHGLSVSALLWLGRYEIGIYQNLRFSSLSKLKKALLYIAIIPLAPIVDFFCGLPTVLAIIVRPKEFQITSKKG